MLPIEHLATSPSCEYHPHPISPPWQVIDTAKLEGKFFKPEARQRRDSQGEIITGAVLAPRSSKVELLEPKRPPPPPPLEAPSPHYTPYGTPHSLPSVRLRSPLPLAAPLHYTPHGTSHRTA